MLPSILFFVLLIGAGVSQMREGDYCVFEYTQTRGVCTISYNCQSARRDYQNGIRPTICGRSSAGTLVCCRDNSNILQVATQRPPTTEARPVWGSSGGYKRLSERKCDEYSRSVQHVVSFVSLVPEPDSYSVTAAKCSYSGVKLIVGGTNAELGEFPHMAAIGWTNFNNGYSWDCGGSLISDRFVLTAGHCARNPNARDPEPAVVRLGDRNIDPSVDDGANPIEVPIRRIIKHPEYCPPKRYNDLALLELLTSVANDFSANIRPACLWAGGEFEQDKAIATGWGISDVQKGLRANELQKVSLSLYDNRHCDRLLLKLRHRNWRGFRDSQLCAGELRSRKDTCQGDSGAPLQLASKDNQCIYHIIALTSFGPKTCGQGQPAVYTRVSSYIDWIESVVWADELRVTPQTESTCPPEE